MVHSGYHPLKGRPVRIVFGWCTVDHPLKDRPVRSSSQDSVWMVHMDIILLRMFGWCTVDIILLKVVLAG